MTIRRTISSRLLLLAVVALLLAACGGGGGDTGDEGDAGDTAGGDAAATDAGATATDGGGVQELGTMSVGLICGGLTPMTAMMAINANTFPEGLEVEKVCFDGGSEAVQALIGGSLDVFMGSMEHVVSTRAQGLPTRAYAAINVRMPYYLLTKVDAGYDDLTALHGQQVGVTSPGSLSDTQLQIAAEQEGADYSQFQVVGIGSGATMVAALANDSVAAGMVSDPTLSELLNSGEYEALWEPTFPYVSIVALANSEVVEENPARMEAFLAGLYEAYQMATEDSQWAIDAMKEEGFEVSDETLASAVERGLTEIPEDLRIDQQTFDETIDLLLSVGRIEEADVPTFEEAVDLDLLPSAS